MARASGWLQCCARRAPPPTPQPPFQPEEEPQPTGTRGWVRLGRLLKALLAARRSWNRLGIHLRQELKGDFSARAAVLRRRWSALGRSLNAAKKLRQARRADVSAEEWRIVDDD